MNAPATPDPAAEQITEEERARLIQLLQDSRVAFLDLVSGLTDTQWTYKAAPDTWSIQEAAEHIVLAESALFSKMEEALAGPPNPAWETATAGKTEFIEKVMPERRRKAQAPGPLHPHGHWTLAETITRFQAGRTRTLRFVAETGLALRNYTSEHPFPVFNALNAYQWLLYIPLHNMRHCRQIVDVKSSAGFPQVSDA